MRLYCSCLNVSVLVQDSAVHFQLPHPDNPARVTYETLCEECHWPSSSLSCVRLSQNFPESLVVVQPELCHHRQVSSPHCTIVECINCHTVVMAFPQGSELTEGSLTFPGLAFVHPNLFCPTQDIETMGVDVLQSFLKNDQNFVPPEQMVLSPAFRIYVPMLQLPSTSKKSSTHDFSSLQQHVQTYLEHAQRLMSSRIAAFIEEQEKVFEEERLRALRDRDALLMVINQHQKAQQQQQDSDKSDDDNAAEQKQDGKEQTSPALESDGTSLAQSYELEQSPMFCFQEDDEKSHHRRSVHLFEVQPPLEDEPSDHDEQVEQDSAVKEVSLVSLGESGTVLLPDPEPAPKVPSMVHRKIPSVTTPSIPVVPRRVGPVLLSGDDDDDASNRPGNVKQEEPDVVLSMYSSSMPIQVPLLEEDYLDLRKRAKRALVMQAYGKAAHSSRSQSTNPSNPDLEGPDLPLSQSFAVPTSLSLRNPFRPE